MCNGILCCATALPFPPSPRIAAAEGESLSLFFGRRNRWNRCLMEALSLQPNVGASVNGGIRCC